MNPWTGNRTVRGLEHGKEGRSWDCHACSDCRGVCGGVRRPSRRYMEKKREVSPKLKHGTSVLSGGKNCYEDIEGLELVARRHFELSMLGDCQDQSPEQPGLNSLLSLL